MEDILLSNYSISQTIQSDKFYMLLMSTEGSRRESSWETLQHLSVPKGATTGLEKDFLKGCVVTGQRGIVLN